MDRTLYIRIQLPRGNHALNDRMLGSDEPPINDQQEDKKGDDNSDHELEVVIPDVVNIGHDLLSQLFAFFCLLSLEEFQHELVGKRAIELDSIAHSSTDDEDAHPQTNHSKCEHQALI